MSSSISWLPVLSQCATQATNPVYNGPTSHSCMNNSVISPQTTRGRGQVYICLLLIMHLPYPVKCSLEQWFELVLVVTYIYCLLLAHIKCLYCILKYKHQHLYLDNWYFHYSYHIALSSSEYTLSKTVNIFTIFVEIFFRCTKF